MTIAKKQIIKFILYIAFLLGLVVVFVYSGIMSVLDGFVRLEETHPGYYGLESKATIKHVPYDVYLNGQINQIVNDISTYENENGFTIMSNADGSLIYTGTNYSDEYVCVTITGDEWCLVNGDYILSDTEIYCQNGAPISTSDFKLSVMANEDSDGKRDSNVMIADASDPGDRSFTVDYGQYDRYSVQLVIAPGYSSEGITVYPMLTSVENAQDDYQPALLRDIAIYYDDDVDLTTYTRITCTKEDYLELTDDDRQLFHRYLRYQAPVNGMWTTIDFGDGTGIYYPENDPGQLQYGLLDAVGQMAILYAYEDTVIE